MDMLELSKNEQKASFDIFQDVLLHDQVANKLECSDNMMLNVTNKPFDHIPEDNDNRIILRLISDLQTLHHQLSALPPDIFQLVRESYSTATDQCSFCIKVQRVGKVTGDLCIELEGPFQEMLHYLNMFLSIDKSTQKTYVSFLMPSHTPILPSSISDHVQTIVTKEPYFLVHGTLVKIQSHDRTLLISFILTHFMFRSELSNYSCSSNYNYPLRSVLKPIGNVNLSSGPTKAKKSSTPEEGNPPKTKTHVELVQLTRPEVTFLIGKHGNKIDRIRKRSNATVKVIPIDMEANRNLKMKSKTYMQFIRVSGTKKQVADALNMIESDIYQFRTGGITTY